MAWLPGGISTKPLAERGLVSVAGVLGGDEEELAVGLEDGGEEEGELGVGLLGGGEREGNWLGDGVAREEVEGGADVAEEGGVGGVGVAGEGEEGWVFATRFPVGEGFAGLLSDAVEGGWADEGFESGADEVFFAFGNAAGKEDEVGGGESFFEGGDGEVEVVGEVTDLDGPVRWGGLQSHAPQDGSVRLDGVGVGGVFGRGGRVRRRW